MAFGLGWRGCFSMWLVWPFPGGPGGCGVNVEHLIALKYIFSISY